MTQTPDENSQTFKGIEGAVKLVLTLARSDWSLTVETTNDLQEELMKAIWPKIAPILSHYEVVLDRVGGELAQLSEELRRQRLYGE